MIPQPLSDPESGPSGADPLRIGVFDHDELAWHRGSGHDADAGAGNVKLPGDDPDQGVICGALHRRGGDPNPKGTVNDAVDAVGAGSGCQADGETDFGRAQDRRATSVIRRRARRRSG